MSKLRPHPDMFASGGLLLIETRRFQDHDNVCPDCGDPLWMHDRERVYPDDGPVGSWHRRLVCR